MRLGPIEASRQALGRARLPINDIYLVEINEAFAAQVIPSAKHLGIDIEKQLNVHGGGLNVSRIPGHVQASLSVTRSA